MLAYKNTCQDWRGKCYSLQFFQWDHSYNVHDGVLTAIPKCPPWASRKDKTWTRLCVVCKRILSQIFFLICSKPAKTSDCCLEHVLSPGMVCPWLQSLRGVPALAWVAYGPRSLGAVLAPVWVTCGLQYFFSGLAQGSSCPSLTLESPARPLLLKPCQFCSLHHTFSLYQKFNLISSRIQCVGIGWQK